MKVTGAGKESATWPGIYVIGMPRSGTSLTTRLLNLAGVYLGPESEMVRAGQWNPKGFWEIRRIEELNRRLLRSLGGEGLIPPPGWADSPTVEAERENARALLDELFAGRERWGMKVTALLPFWQELMPPMRYAICVRNPLDVAASLQGREGIDRAGVLEVWPRQVAAALAYTAGSHRIVVSYDDYVEAPRRTARRLWRFAGNQEPPGEAALRELEAAVDPELLHHRTPAPTAIDDMELPLPTCTMYAVTELLRGVEAVGAGGGGERGAWSAVDVHARRLLVEHFETLADVDRNV